jgi:hypothetical protein
MGRKSRAAEVPESMPAAPNLVHLAADKITAAVETIGSLAHRAAGATTPDAQRARRRATPYTQQAVDSVSPYAQQLSGVVGPYAQTAKQRGARLAHDAVEKLGPTLEDALDKVPPAVEIARTRVHDEVLPKLADALAAAAAVPVVVEAADAVENHAGPASNPKRRWLKRLIIVVAIGGVAAIVARELLGSSDRDGQTAEQTAPHASEPGPSPATSPSSTWFEATDHISAPAAANSPTGVNPDEDSATTAVTITDESPDQLESELDTIENAAGIDTNEHEVERGGVDADRDELPVSNAAAERN